MMRILPDPAAPGGYRIVMPVATVDATQAQPCYTCPADATVIYRVLSRKQQWPTPAEDLAVCPKHIEMAKGRGRVLKVTAIGEAVVERRLG